MFWKSNTPLKGYTLSEMVIVMLTTTIIISFCFGVLQYLNRTFHTYEATLNLLSQQERIEDLIFHDMDQFENILIKPPNRIVFFNAIDTVHYQFNPNSLIREQDTLLHHSFKINFYNYGQPVVLGWVDAIEILYSKPRNRAFFFFQYTSSSKRLHNEF